MATKGTPKHDGSGRFVAGVAPVNKIVLPEVQLRELYQYMGTKMIARVFGVSKTTVLRNLSEYRIPKRATGAPNQLPAYWKRALCVPKSKPNWAKGQTKGTHPSLRKLSLALVGSKSPRWKPELHTGEKVFCKCGCGGELPMYDKRGRRRYYLVGHCSKGRFTSERVSGSKSNNWKGGITSHMNALRKSAQYASWRLTVYKRDHYCCQMCSSKTRQLTAHHILPFDRYPELRFVVDNGITLCRSCHLKIHREKGFTSCQTETKKGRDHVVLNQVGV